MIEQEPFLWGENPFLLRCEHRSFCGGRELSGIEFGCPSNLLDLFCVQSRDDVSAFRLAGSLCLADRPCEQLADRVGDLLDFVR